MHTCKAIVRTLLLGLATAGLRGEPALTADGFPVPEAGHEFSFPRDHGSHPDFRLEWWYITGHAFGAGGRRLGFQATFFRSAAPHDGSGGGSDPRFGTGQLYLAHMALLDTATGRFIYQERLNRQGWDAQADTGRLSIVNGPWSLAMEASPSQTMRLHGSVRSEAAFDFVLTPRKPLVIFGSKGVSRKGAAASAASYYLTFPRLGLAGRITLGKEDIEVTGEAWMDHEISSSQLDPGQVGWDWACLQLRNGQEAMCYRMRRRDGTVDPFSTLAWINPEGGVTHYPPSQFGWKVLATWTSPVTGAVYPVRVAITLAPEGSPARTFILEPLAKAQELAGGAGGIPYWEGGCRVLDERGADIGNAFLELTGYAQPLRL